jgi:hypothetical protein
VTELQESDSKPLSENMILLNDITIKKLLKMIAEGND